MMEIFSRIRPTVSLLVVLLATVMMTEAPLRSQQSTGSVTGVVADSTGAVIPKAQVTLTNEIDGTSRTTVSNSSGAFALAAVMPSTSCRLKVEATGFRPWESQPFALRAGDELGFNDQIRLVVGDATASVTVEAITDTMSESLDTGERSDIITAKDLDTLTVVGRDATELVRMLPGYAMSTGDQGLFNRPGYNTAVVGLSGPTGAFSANGTGPTGIAVVTDGVSLTDIASNSGTVQQVNIEMVSEVKADSSSFSAVTAKGPAVINATSKTGGHTFHGEAYLTGRDTAFNSNDWYDNFLRRSRPDGRYFFPGGQIGGPLLLPFTKFNHNRDKLFFEAMFEYYNQQFEANQQALTAWVPTLAERQGDFSPTSLDAQLCGGRPDGAANPNSIQPMCYSENYLPDGTLVGNYNAQPYANSGGVALVNWFPQPNADPFTNPFGYNYIQQLMQQQNGEQFKATLEYNIDEKDSLFLVYGLQKEVDEDPVALGYFPTGGVPYAGNVTTGDISTVLAARYARMISPTVTNEFDVALSFVSLPGKMGTPLAVSRFNLNTYNGGNGNFNYLGMYKNGGDYSVPAINGYGGLGYPNVLMPGGFYNNQIRTKKVDPILQDNMSWQKGNHFLQYGVYWETGTYNGIADGGSYPQGEFTFNPGNGYFEYNSAPFTSAQFVSCSNPSTAGTQRNAGSAYLGSCMNPTALAYMGYADSFTQTNFTPTVDMRYMTMAGFLNDKFKYKNLTVILGARVEHLGPWSDKHKNGLATFDSNLYNSECGGFTRNCNSANMPGLTWASLNKGVQNSVNKPSKAYLSPRLGMAWDVTGKNMLVVRAGWGIYRAEEQFNPYALAAATAQNYKTSVLQGTLTFNGVDSQSPLNPPDFSVYTLSPDDTLRPTYYEYNLGINQQLPWHSRLDLAFVGGRSDHLGSYNGSSYNSASDMNIICGIETGCPYNQNPENPQNTLFTVNLGDVPESLTAIQNVGCGISCLDTPETDFYRPYPFYQHVYQLKHNYYSTYNSLQMAWNKQSGFVSYGANYTFSKDLATASSWNNVIADPVNLRNDYNPVPFDRSQVFNIHYLVDQTQRFQYRGGSRILSEFANGWQISGVSSLMSGFPLASEQGQNFSFGYGSILPVQTEYQNQSSVQSDSTCSATYHIPSNSKGQTLCVSGMSPVVWLGTPDVQLMPTLKGSPVGGKAKHQFINPLAFGLPLPESNGAYRLPYIHGPAYLDHDVTLLKNFSMGEKRNLQVRMAAFNVFNHPLVSFNNQNTNNLTLSFQNATAGQNLTQNVLQYQNFGVADIKVGNRLMELEGKFTF
ncbi:MAG TPA: carboxypeptidase-like regulatory domain-containing protein [Terracidiphilus sp.]|jgi:hypothetical protein|nr:carboxypeptidase-like regulatory domain-containing protein [Terracidiphilus sp.]